MERRFAYPAKVEQDEAGSFLVAFPDFPEAATDGRSREGALAEAADCLEEAVAGRIKRGEDIPPPSRAPGDVVPIALSTLYVMKAALYLALREADLSPADLAAKLGKDEKEAHRLLDPRRASRMEALEAALRAVGKRVQVIVAELGEANWERKPRSPPHERNTTGFYDCRFQAGAQSAWLNRMMTDGLDVVAVWIENECTIVMWMIIRSEARFAVVASSGGHCR